METYANYNYYKNEYKGTMSQTDFEKNVIDVQMYIKRHTYDRIDTKKVQDEVKLAFCKIIEITLEAEQKKAEMGNLKSQNIEGWQETYISPEEIDQKLEKDKYSILNTYLWNLIGKDGNLLLYSGV